MSVKAEHWCRRCCLEYVYCKQANQCKEHLWYYEDLDSRKLGAAMEITFAKPKEEEDFMDARKFIIKGIISCSVIIAFLQTIVIVINGEVGNDTANYVWFAVLLLGGYIVGVVYLLTCKMHEKKKGLLLRGLAGLALSICLLSVVSASFYFDQTVYDDQQKGFLFLLALYFFYVIAFLLLLLIRLPQDKRTKKTNLKTELGAMVGVLIGNIIVKIVLKNASENVLFLIIVTIVYTGALLFIYYSIKAIIQLFILTREALPKKETKKHN